MFGWNFLHLSGILCFKTEIPVFQFVLLVSCPFFGLYWEESGSIFFTPLLPRVVIRIVEISPELFYLWGE